MVHSSANQTQIKLEKNNEIKIEENKMGPKKLYNAHSDLREVLGSDISWFRHGHTKGYAMPTSV